MAARTRPRSIPTIYPAMLFSGVLLLVLAVFIAPLPAGPAGQFSLPADSRLLEDYQKEQLRFALSGIKPLWSQPYDTRAAALLLSFFSDSTQKIDPLLLNTSLLAAEGYLTDGTVPVIATFSGTPTLSGTSLPLINGVAAALTPDEITELSRQPGTKKIYLDRTVSLPEPLTHPDLSLLPEDNRNQLTAADAAQARGFDGSGVTIAVIDTGIDKNHPDLLGKVAAEISFVQGESPADGHGHGTHVASTIAGSGAASNGRYKGIAPGARLLNVKVLDNRGSGWTSDILQGMQWAADNGADIISMSLGGFPTTINNPLTEAANKLMAEGTVMVIAAGNEGWS